jgi:hypothetical protein
MWFWSKDAHLCDIMTIPGLQICVLVRSCRRGSSPNVGIMHTGLLRVIAPGEIAMEKAGLSLGVDGEAELAPA